MKKLHKYIAASWQCANNGKPVKITPAEAEYFLREWNDSNRSKKLGKIEAITELIVEDKFGPSWDLVAFYDDGQLANGQHRLSGCALSQKPIYMIVVMGIPLSTKDYGDTGTPRSVKDITNLQHMPSGSFGAAVSRSLIKTASGFTITNSKITKQKVVENYKDRFKSIKAICEIIETTEARKHYLVKASLGAALVEYFDRDDKNAQIFGYLVISPYDENGCGLPKNHPALKIRNYLGSKSCRGNSDHHQAEEYKKIVGAIHEFQFNNFKPNLVKKDGWAF